MRRGLSEGWAWAADGDEKVNGLCVTVWTSALYV